MRLTPKEYLKIISLLFPYFFNVTLQQCILSKKVCIKTPKIDLEVSTNMQFVTFWSTPCVISIKELIYVIFLLLVAVCVLVQIRMILTFMYSTIFVSSRCVPSNNFFLSLFFKDCLAIISSFQDILTDLLYLLLPFILTFSQILSAKILLVRISYTL